MLLVWFLLRTIKIQGREYYLRDFINCAFDIGLCHDGCKLISFKLGMMLDMTEVCSITPI